MDVQAQRLCDVLSADDNLEGLPFDIIGFKDGGLIARAAAQTCLRQQGRICLAHT